MAAALSAPAAQIKLKRPVTPGRAFFLRKTGYDLVELHDPDGPLAEGSPSDLKLDVPRPVSLAEAEAASHRFPGHDRHLFPGCFACGPEREEGDGLHVFPGPVAGRRLVAAPWTPPEASADDSGRVPNELAWAAMDCTQLWALMVHAPTATPDRVVTASLAARVEGPVMAGERHVVIGWPIGRVGRKWSAGAAVFGADGRLRVAWLQKAAVVSGWGVPLGRDHWATQVAAA
jgi:hypothetical protein